ncbi:hypothetical protein LCGC14_0680770 [marine sediment metagenome]|uniref:Flagellar protein FliL n=1 Tax=marine sediment metagenome TaxID=412755 RepID=A0A0F9QT59_9ZZZZ
MTKQLPLIGFLFASLMSHAAVSFAKEEAIEAPIYYKIEEPFVINFSNQSNNRVRFLQVKVALMAKEQTIIDSAILNLPMIQDELRTLFSEQNYNTVSTLDGRKKLHALATEDIQSLLREESGVEGLEKVYFTSFIVQ